ncbi:MAG: hypothetical protein KBE65_19100 [Phycisphaerae bacterium]|nr:hypothetical protein [Phycisphaerae bacterium]
MSISQTQNPEHPPENLAEQLAQANARIAQMSEELDGLQIEQKLAHKLAAAGAIDLEAAVLVARAKIDGRTETDIDSCVTQLRKEKSYLFGGSTPVAVPRKTASAKDRLMNHQTTLEQAAKRAAQTGKRADLLRYLNLRRSVM